MKKGDFGSILNSQNGRVNIALLLSIVLIFVLSILYVEALTIKLISPTNTTYNGSRSINFTFNVTWQAPGEDLSNCSIWTNETSGWHFGAANDTGNGNGNVTNGTGGAGQATLSYINYTYSRDGNFTWSVGCLNESTVTGRYNFSYGNFSFFIDSVAPRTIPVTPNGVYTTNTQLNITSNETAVFYVNISDNSTYNVWAILNTGVSLDPTGKNETRNRTMTFVETYGDAVDYRLYKLNISNIINFTSNFTGPGAHSIFFCANDTFGRISCSNRTDFIVKGMPVDEMERQFGGEISHPEQGFLFKGLDVRYGNGTDVPSGTFMNPTAGNFTFHLNFTDRSGVYIVGGRIDENQFANASRTNYSNQVTSTAQNEAGNRFKSNMTWVDIRSFIPSEVRYEYGVIQMPDTYNKVMFCNGTTTDSPNCFRISGCNATSISIFNHTNVIPANSACYIGVGSWGVDNTQSSLESGFTYIFVDHFSGGIGANDLGPPNVTFNTPRIDLNNNSINRSTTVTQLINFMVDDAASTGLNLTMNNSINVTIKLGGSVVALFNYTNGSDSGTRLTCVSSDANAPQNSFNITCNATFAFSSNGTYLINITGRDTSNNSNAMNTTNSFFYLTVDQIPPRSHNIFGNIHYYNITHNSTWDTTKGHNDLPELGLGDVFSTAQGRTIYAVSNWTDNLTQVFQGAFQFYNETSGSWKTLRDSNSNLSGAGGIGAYNASNFINFSFSIPVARGEFEGRNVSFRIIANDTLGNINTSDVKNFTIQINDTVKPTLLVSSVGGVDVSNLSNTSDTTPTIVWNVTESNGLRYIAVQIDGSTSVACNKFVNYTAADVLVDSNRNGSITVSGSGACPLLNGTRVVRLTAEDYSGNTELYIHSFEVQSGNVPTITLSTIASSAFSAVNGTSVTSSTGINFTATVETGLLKNLSFTSSCNSTGGLFTNETFIKPFGDTCVGASANRTVSVTASDFAGNSVTKLFQFNVDDVGPSIAIQSPTNGGNFANNLSLNWSVKDDSINVSLVGYYLDGLPTITVLNFSATGQSGPSVNFSDSRSLNFTPGTHTIKFTVNDSLGNIRNSSVITFTINGPLNLDILGFNDSLGPGNTSLGLFNVNMSLVRLTNASGASLNGTTTLTDQTLSLFMALNATTKGINVTITFNASAANWDMYNFTVKQNDSAAITNINDNWTVVMKDILWFNESIQLFLPNNNSYYANVKYPINASVDIIGGQFEIWYFKDIKDLTTKRNVSECSASFNPSFTFTESQACWNNTDNHSVNIFVPHFSLLAFTNNSLAPTANVSFPNGGSDNASTPSMFVPNITVSADAITCKYQLNTSTPPYNITMTKTGSICIGQTERFNNSNGVPAGYNITFWVIDDDGNTNQYIWGFNMSDTTPPNTPNATRISTSLTSSTSTITISGINESVNVTLLYGTTVGALSSTTRETDFNQSQAVSITGLTASTLYHFNLSICDFNGNCAKNGTFNFTTSAAAAAAAAASTTSSSSGGGGGGAAASNVQASAGRQWDTLAVGSSGVLTINNGQIAITSVEINVANAVSNPSIEVQSLTSNPLTAAAAAKVYQYLQLVKSNIADLDASKITITFKVPKSWLASNGAGEDDIVLYRYSDGNWNALPTTKAGSDGDYVTYQSTTPGFSTFAIGTKEAAPTAAPPTEAVPEAPTTPPAEAPVTPEAPPAAAPQEEAMEKKGLSNTAIGWIVVLAIVAVAGIGYFMYQKKQER